MPSPVPVATIIVCVLCLLLSLALITQNGAQAFMVMSWPYTAFPKYWWFPRAKTYTAYVNFYILSQILPPYFFLQINKKKLLMCFDILQITKHFPIKWKLTFYEIIPPVSTKSKIISCKINVKFSFQMNCILMYFAFYVTIMTFILYDIWRVLKICGKITYFLIYLTLFFFY